MMVAAVCRSRRGFFLVLVLVVITVATMAVYSFSELMIAADETAHLSGDIVQSRCSTDSAIELIKLFLASPPIDRDAAGGVFNNPAMFQAVPVANEPGEMNQFTIIAPNLTDTGTLGGIRYGLQDESARLNINALPILEANSGAISSLSLLSGGDVDPVGMLGGGDADGMGGLDGLDASNLAVTLLMSLPGMDESIADAILDFLDEDSEVRPLGCEDEYYLSLPSPYSPANGPLNSVEELLLVRGVTPALLFGADANRNGVIDADEQQRFVATNDTQGAFGWATYLTVHGTEVNKTADGQFRVDVNQEDLEVLYEDLQATGMDINWASFIVAYRMYGQSNLTDLDALTGNGQQDDSNEETESQNEPLVWTAEALDDFDLTAGAGVSLNQLLDLVDAKVVVGEGENSQTYLSPFVNQPDILAEMLPVLMDLCTTQSNDSLPGRININECPAELLAGLTMVAPEAINAILEARSEGSAGASMLGGDASVASRNHETWPLTEGLITLGQMRALLPLVNAGGDVFRAQMVGYNSQTGLFHRAEAIIDATTPNPQMVQYRDLSHLGRGFEMSVLGSRVMPSEP